MPNPGSDLPLRKVTLNLYEEDCAELERIHPGGWTTRIREIVHSRVKDIKSPADYHRLRKTLGDLE